MSPQDEVAVALEHYNRASRARRRDDFDGAVAELDACLCMSPPPPLAVLAWYHLGEVIFLNFGFANRHSSSLSDEEYYWSLRAGEAVRNAIDVYEQTLAGRVWTTDQKLAVDCGRAYENAKEQQKFLAVYDPFVRDTHGESQFRPHVVFHRVVLPPLHCLSEYETRMKEVAKQEYERKRESPIHAESAEAAVRGPQDERAQQEIGGPQDQLRASIDPNGKITWYCQFCEDSIGEDALSNWRCPVCRNPNKDRPLDWVNCLTCGFSPTYFVCPNCSCEFDVKLFNFNVYGDGSRRQRLGQFVVSCGENLKNDIEHLSAVTKEKLQDIEFELPIIISAVHLNSYHVGDALEWFHFSLLASEDSECVAAYMSIEIPDQDRAKIAYLHGNSIPSRSGDTPIINEAGLKRTLDPKIQRIIRSLRVQEE